jgi:hypothetical protein
MILEPSPVSKLFVRFKNVCVIRALGSYSLLSWVLLFCGSFKRPNIANNVGKHSQAVGLLSLENEKL